MGKKVVIVGGRLLNAHAQYLLQFEGKLEG